MLRIHSELLLILTRFRYSGFPVRFAKGAEHLPCNICFIEVERSLLTRGYRTPVFLWFTIAACVREGSRIPW